MVAPLPWLRARTRAFLETDGKEFHALFTQAGLELTRTIELVNGYAIIEAQPSV